MTRTLPVLIPPFAPKVRQDNRPLSIEANHELGKNLPLLGYTPRGVGWMALIICGLVMLVYFLGG
jgi:hypothetical protein